MDLEDQYLQMVNQALVGAVPCLVKSRQRTTPKGRGTLQESITGRSDRRGRGFRVTVEQDGDKAPHGQIINNPKQPSGRITAKGRALRFESGGNTIFRKSVEQSTKHKGWWDDFDWVGQFEKCLGRQLL